MFTERSFYEENQNVQVFMVLAIEHKGRNLLLNRCANCMLRGRLSEWRQGQSPGETPLPGVSEKASLMMGS